MSLLSLLNSEMFMDLGVQINFITPKKCFLGNNKTYPTISSSNQMTDYFNNEEMVNAGYCNVFQKFL